MTSYYRSELGLPEMGLVGRQLWEQSGLTPADIQAAVVSWLPRDRRVELTVQPEKP